MFYSIVHLTSFRYGAVVSESVMEVRMQPRSEGNQRCLTFDLLVNPRANVMLYRDFLGNAVHHFDIPGSLTHLTVRAEAMVDVQPGTPVETLQAGGWDELDAQVARGDYWEMLAPSHFARPTELLRGLARELRLERRHQPLDALRELNEGVHKTFDYVRESTQVDSPIDDALRNRHGVCQDFAHIMTALAREVGIPCRYVSGYLYHSVDAHDRSVEGASHAWVEAYLPGPGWVGFDPTNNLMAGECHIRVAIGRDYADVPPTRGVHKGAAPSELSVAVRIAPADAPLPEDLLPATVVRTVSANSADSEQDMAEQQQ